MWGNAQNGGPRAPQLIGAGAAVLACGGENRYGNGVFSPAARARRVPAHGSRRSTAPTAWAKSSAVGGVCSACVSATSDPWNADVRRNEGTPRSVQTGSLVVCGRSARLAWWWRNRRTLAETGRALGRASCADLARSRCRQLPFATGPRHGDSQRSTAQTAYNSPFCLRYGLRQLSAGVNRC